MKGSTLFNEIKNHLLVAPRRNKFDKVNRIDQALTLYEHNKDMLSKSEKEEISQMLLNLGVKKLLT